MAMRVRGHHLPSLRVLNILSHVKGEREEELDHNKTGEHNSSLDIEEKWIGKIGNMMLNSV